MRPVPRKKSLGPLRRPARHFGPKCQTVLTADTGFTHWKTLFPSEPMAVDRLVDRATLLRFTEETCRNPREVVGASLDD